MFKPKNYKDHLQRLNDGVFGRGERRWSKANEGVYGIGRLGGPYLEWQASTYPERAAGVVKGQADKASEFSLGRLLAPPDSLKPTRSELKKAKCDRERQNKILNAYNALYAELRAYQLDVRKIGADKTPKQQVEDDVNSIFERHGNIIGALNIPYGVGGDLDQIKTDVIQKLNAREGLAFLDNGYDPNQPERVERQLYEYAQQRYQLQQWGNQRAISVNGTPVSLADLSKPENLQAFIADQNGQEVVITTHSKLNEDTNLRLFADGVQADSLWKMAVNTISGRVDPGINVQDSCQVTFKAETDDKGSVLKDEAGLPRIHGSAIISLGQTIRFFTPLSEKEKMDRVREQARSLALACKQVGATGVSVNFKGDFSEGEQAAFQEELMRQGIDITENAADKNGIHPIKSFKLKGGPNSKDQVIQLKADDLNALQALQKRVFGKPLPAGVNDDRMRELQQLTREFNHYQAALLGQLHANPPNKDAIADAHAGMMYAHERFGALVERLEQLSQDPNIPPDLRGRILAATGQCEDQKKFIAELDGAKNQPDSPPALTDGLDESPKKVDQLRKADEAKKQAVLAAQAAQRPGAPVKKG